MWLLEPGGEQTSSRWTASVVATAIVLLQAHVPMPCPGRPKPSCQTQPFLTQTARSVYRGICLPQISPLPSGRQFLMSASPSTHSHKHRFASSHEAVLHPCPLPAGGHGHGSEREQPGRLCFSVCENTEHVCVICSSVCMLACLLPYTCLNLCVPSLNITGPELLDEPSASQSHQPPLRPGPLSDPAGLLSKRGRVSVLADVGRGS